MGDRMRWTVGARSETGYVRLVNEDRMGWTPTAYGDVYVVADGMGGHRGGSLAAELTISSLQRQLALISPAAEDFRDDVRQAFHAANREVYSQRDPTNPETSEMGSTAVAVITFGSRFMVAHVGDSRAYLWRSGLGLRQLTKDHTRVQSLLDAGLLSPQEAAVHPDASVLERAIGHRAEVDVDVGEWLSLEAGDRVLLCSDGLSAYVAEDEIARILSAAEPAQEATDRLVECALGKGGEDNVTVQIIGYGNTDDTPAGWWSSCNGLRAACARLARERLRRRADGALLVGERVVSGT